MAKTNSEVVRDVPGIIDITEFDHRPPIVNEGSYTVYTDLRALLQAEQAANNAEDRRFVEEVLATQRELGPGQPIVVRSLFGKVPGRVKHAQSGQ